MDYLLCITRSTTGLEAKVNRCLSSFRPPESGLPNWQNLYETASVPFKDIKQSPTTQRLCTAWQRLKAVDKWDAATLTDVLVVLTESVATYDASSPSFPILRAESAPPKPTAAHPRAFRGTKYKPPKLKRPAPVNLQIALRDLKNQAIVLQALWQHRDKAIKPLCDFGYDSLLIESLLALSTPPTEPNRFLRYHEVPIHSNHQLFPRTFREEILPLLRGISWHRVEATLDLFWHLELHEQLELRTTVSRFLAQSPTPSALDWLQHIANQSSEHHITLLIFAVELNVARSPCPVGVDEVLNALHEFASLERYPQWAYILLAALRDGISADYLRDGVHLAGEFSPRYRFDYPKPCEEFSRKVVEEVLYRLPDDDGIGGWAMAIWKAAAKLTEFCDVLATVEWASLTPQQVSAYLQMLLNFSYYYEDDEAEAASWQAKWRFFKKYQVQIEECLRFVSEAYLEQWVNDFKCFLKPNMDNTVFADLIKDAATLATRLAQPPYRSDSDRGLAFGQFIQIHDAVLRQRVLDTPEVSLKCLDKACRRENDAKLITWGLAALIKKHASFAVDCLWHSPQKLVKTTKLLGTMSWEFRLEIVRDFVRHPIMTVDFNSLSLRDIYDTIQTLEATRRCNPISRALRDYFEGKRTLRYTQLERHRKTILDRLLETKLQVLEDIAEQALWRGFETASNLPDAKHALQLFRDLFSNKRAFRRFLKEYITGNANYLHHHPLTLKFAQRHPQIDWDIWTRGIILENYEEKQYISITLEQKPLEVLKLGTYVGSCLGIGGIMTDSAVAVMLDANKQVLYARDENGVVLARQLVAISKDDQVVAFEVYPLNTSSRIKALFQTYDKHFAHVLGIKLFNDESNNYEIEHILSAYWWDDGAWDFGNE